MTNAEAAAHFAALPAEALAEVLLIEADTSSAENFTLDPPGTNLDAYKFVLECLEKYGRY